MDLAEYRSRLDEFHCHLGLVAKGFSKVVWEITNQFPIPSTKEQDELCALAFLLSDRLNKLDEEMPFPGDSYASGQGGLPQASPLTEA